MLVVVVVLLAVLVVLALAVLAAAVAPHLVTIRRRRVIVNLHSGSAITGVVIRDRGRRLVLVDAELHEGGSTAPMDGQAVIEKSQVAFVQVLPARDPATAGS